MKRSEESKLPSVTARIPIAHGTKEIAGSVCSCGIRLSVVNFGRGLNTAYPYF